MTMLVLSMTSAPTGVALETRCVSSGQFSIGRDGTNDWVLPDPLRQLSRRHCLFVQDDEGWSLSDMSRNGVSFDHDGKGSSKLDEKPRRLGAGDRIRAGGYELVVDLQEDESSFRIMPLPGFVAEAIKGLRAGATTANANLSTSHVPKRSARRRTGFDDTLEMPRVIPRGPVEGAAANSDALLDILGLDGASVPPARRAVVLYRLGASLDAFVRGLRRLVRAGEDFPGRQERDVRQAAWRRSPLVTEVDDEKVLRWISGLRSGRAEAPELAIADAFDELQRHQVCLERAYKRCVRGVLDVLDPDYLPGEEPVSPVDMLSPWRRIKATALLRKRYRRLRSNFDVLFEAEFARTYREEWERMSPR